MKILNAQTDAKSLKTFTRYLLPRLDFENLAAPVSGRARGRDDTHVVVELGPEVGEHPPGPGAGHRAAAVARVAEEQMERRPTDTLTAAGVGARPASEGCQIDSAKVVLLQIVNSV